MATIWGISYPVVFSSGVEISVLTGLIPFVASIRRL